MPTTAESAHKLDIFNTCLETCITECDQLSWNSSPQLLSKTHVHPCNGGQEESELDHSTGAPSAHRSRPPSIAQSSPISLWETLVGLLCTGRCMCYAHWFSSSSLSRTHPRILGNVVGDPRGCGEEGCVWQLTCSEAVLPGSWRKAPNILLWRQTASMGMAVTSRRTPKI